MAANDGDEYNYCTSDQPVEGLNCRKAFETDELFATVDDAVGWACGLARVMGFKLIKSQQKLEGRKIQLKCNRGERYRKRESVVAVSKQRKGKTKRCGCTFRVNVVKYKSKDGWLVRLPAEDLMDGFHNHPLFIDPEAHSQRTTPLPPQTGLDVPESSNTVRVAHNFVLGGTSGVLDGEGSRSMPRFNSVKNNHLVSGGMSGALDGDGSRSMPRFNPVRDNHLVSGGTSGSEFSLDRAHFGSVQLSSSVHRELELNELDGVDTVYDEPVRATLPSVKRDHSGRFMASSGTSKRPRQDDVMWMVSEPVPGGPIDGSVIPSFLGHVTSRIWDGNIRGPLKCHNRASGCNVLREWYQRLSEHARKLVYNTGLSHLPNIMFSKIDLGLISAFVERWQPDTNSFHMPFGEMTIMLHDVWYILGITVDGEQVSAIPTMASLRKECADLLGMAVDMLSPPVWANGSIHPDTLLKYCSETQSEDTQARAWIWMMLESTLFGDKSGNRLRSISLSELFGEWQGVSRYSWGSATLAYLYRQLGIASRGDCSGITGCLTLLQAWIYEYFPDFEPEQENGSLARASICKSKTSDYEQLMCARAQMARASMWKPKAGERHYERLISCRERLEEMTISSVRWLPYCPKPACSLQRTLYSGWIMCRDVIEPYMPGRVLRQIGYVQTIPRSLLRPATATRPWCSKSYSISLPMVVAQDSWMAYPDNSIKLDHYTSTLVDDPGACVVGYMDWYTRHSHPRLLPLVARTPSQIGRFDQLIKCFEDMSAFAMRLVNEELDEEMAEVKKAEWESIRRARDEAE